MALTTLTDLDLHLYQAEETLRGSIVASDYQTYTFPILFFKRISDVYDEEISASNMSHRFIIPCDCHWNDVLTKDTDIGKALKDSFMGIESANEGLSGIFGDVSWTNKDLLPDSLLSELLQLFSEVDLSSKNVSNDYMGRVYEYLLKRSADSSGKKKGEFYTPRGIVRLMVSILDPKAGESIYDPACGTGGTLLETIRHVKKNNGDPGLLKLKGQEKSLTSESIARMNLFLHGQEDFHIVRGDTLREPKFLVNDRLETFDCVIANPPFSSRGWGHELWINDPHGRNQYGLPPKNKGDIAWVQHMLASLKENGRMAILTTMGVLFRSGAEGEIRQKLVEADLIETIVGLPASLLPYTGIPTCILVINKNKQDNRKGKILFINASNEYSKDRYRNNLESEHIEKITTVFSSFRDEKLFAKVVSLVEIRDNKYNLNISRYVDNSETGALVRQFYENFSDVRFSDVALEINSVSQDKSFSEKDNAIYVPRTGKLLVEANLEDLQRKHSHYYQVVLCTKRVVNIYLKYFFESDIGKHVLSSTSNTSIVPMITKEGLADCLLALPSLEDQQKNIEIHHKLSQLETSIRDIKSELTSNPVLLTDFADQLDGMLEASNKLTEADAIRSLIRKGESKTLEFKETFSLCVREQKKADYVELSALKTVAAFLNSDGGVLLIGVSDDQLVTGLDMEIKKFHKNDPDKFLNNSFKNKLKNRIGPAFYPLINYDLINVDGLIVLKCVCQKSPDPCFIDGEDFYVRTNPASDKLKTPAEQWEYMKKRFPQQEPEVQGVPLAKAEW